MTTLRLFLTYPLGLLACGGCSPIISTSSVPPTADASTVDGLMGEWLTRRKESVIYLHLGSAMLPSGDDHRDSNIPGRNPSAPQLEQLMRAIVVERFSDGRVRSGSYVFYTSRVGEHTYVSIPMFNKDGHVDHYCLTRYSLEGDALRVWHSHDRRSLVKAIRDRNVKGTIAKELIGEVGHLGADGESLQSFLKSSGAKLFPERREFTITFQRR